MDDVAVAAIRERMAESGASYAEAQEWYLMTELQTGSDVPAAVEHVAIGTCPCNGCGNKPGPWHEEHCHAYEEDDDIEPNLYSEFENVGDVNSEEKGSGARYNKGKAPLNFIPFYQFLTVMTGYVKQNNYTHLKCIGLLEILSSWQRGEDSMVRVMQGLDYSDMVASSPVWAYGAEKYAAWNWMKGMDWSVPIGCIMRHIAAIMVDGEDYDPESGLSHWGHVICNVQMLYHFTLTYPEGNDQPPKEAW